MQNRNVEDCLVVEVFPKARSLAADWIAERIGKAFPKDCLPGTGLAAIEKDGGNGVFRVRAAAFCFFAKEVPVAYCGWCIASPANRPAESYRAIRKIFDLMPVYARQHGAKHLFSVFGNRGINRILDNAGFLTGDPAVQHKYLNLETEGKNKWLCQFWQS